MRISDGISDVCSSDLAWKTFLSGNYHHPGDDMSQKIDWQAGARFAEANYRIARAMADSDTTPLWYKGDYFGNLFAPEDRKSVVHGKNVEGRGNLGGVRLIKKKTRNRRS